MSERLACGSTENRSTRLPWLASQKALVAERVVFPSPPLPPNMMYRRSGWLSKTALSDMASSLAQYVGDVAFAKHAAFPSRDLRSHMGQEPERVVGREDRHAQEVAHRDQDEQMLHAGPLPDRVARHLVGRHPIDDVLEDPQNPALLLRFLVRRHGGHILPSPRSPCAAPCGASRWRPRGPHTGAAGASTPGGAAVRRSGHPSSPP